MMVRAGFAACYDRSINVLLKHNREDTVAFSDGSEHNFESFLTNSSSTLIAPTWFAFIPQIDSGKKKKDKTKTTSREISFLSLIALSCF